ncbi:hypothetical protein BDZ89DRAFT_1063242 [Hymenopellis radicata]|nr:hypothetical protein BDZ89DRAFT_1063242 [Hymenopellis radicata]
MLFQEGLLPIVEYRTISDDYATRRLEYGFRRHQRRIYSRLRTILPLEVRLGLPALHCPMYNYSSIRTAVVTFLLQVDLD